MITKSIQNSLRQLNREKDDNPAQNSRASKDGLANLPNGVPAERATAYERDRITLSPAAASNDNSPYARFSEYGFALTSNERESIAEILGRHRKQPRNSETFRAIKADLAKAGLDPTTLAARDQVASLRGRSAVLDEMTGKSADVSVARLHEQQTEKTRIFWEKLRQLHSEMSRAPSSQK